MNVNHSLLDFFLNAGPVVKFVMIILLLASILSWTFIFQRWSFLAKVRRQMQKFEKKFWSGIDLRAYYQELLKQKNTVGLGTIFTSGFQRIHALKG